MESNQGTFAKTVCLLGDPIGCAGITVWSDVGETWALFSPLIKSLPKSLFRACRQGIRDSINELKPAILYARADQNDEIAQRFLERLGYEMESYLYVLKCSKGGQ